MKAILPALKQLKPVFQKTMPPSTQSHIDLFHNKLSFLKTKFYFKPDQIDIIQTPAAFYDTLKHKISKAQNRIFLASLYLGRNEVEFVDCISQALEKNPKLKVFFLIDGLRGTRESPSRSSASLLARLPQKFHERVDIRLYKTPECIGWKEKLIPKRFNEGLGLQHMKIYGFDDEIILSGANLSSDYFTNRQDRYYIFKLKSFSDYYFKLHQLISSFSYQLVYTGNAGGYDLKWPSYNAATEPALSKRQFLRKTSVALQEFLTTDHSLKEDNSSKNSYPTVVYPISQLTPLFLKHHDYSTEKKSMLAVLSSINSPSINWVFTAGYFNMLPDIKSMLLGTPSANCTVITASPYANGFYLSKGVSKHLPDAYLHLSKKFLKAARRYNKAKDITLTEWKRGIANTTNGWTYHAKGLWIWDSSSAEQNPYCTIIGSSNYTRRAYSLDLETNALIVTTDPDLRYKMQKELEHLKEYTSPVSLQDFKTDPERHVSIGVRIATALLGKRL